MKRTMVVGNWKEHPASLKEAQMLARAVKQKTARMKNVAVKVAVPAAFLHGITLGTRSLKVQFGAQDVSAFAGGANTGELSADMLKSVGATFTLVGHSETRKQGATNELVKEKVLRALGAGLEVVLCVGEHERDPEGQYLSFVTAQLESALLSLTPRDLTKITIAYEPVFLIGKSHEFALTGSDVHEMVIFIRKFLAEKFNRSRAELIPILYGAAVERENAHDLIRRGEVDGVLVGHASLDPDSFKDIVSLVSQV